LPGNIRDASIATSRNYLNNRKTDSSQHLAQRFCLHGLRYALQSRGHHWIRLLNGREWNPLFQTKISENANQSWSILRVIPTSIEWQNASYLSEKPVYQGNLSPN
jgi:hypothetical protein